MSSDNEEGGGGESVPEFDPNAVELPPDVEQFLAEIRSGKKTLMRGVAYAKDLGQLRAFIGTYLFTYLEKTIVLLTVGYLDALNLAASSAEDVKKLRRRVRDLEDEDRGSGSGGIDEDDADELAKMNDDMLQALVGLAGILEKKLPADEEAHESFNRCVDIAKAVQEFLGDDDDDKPSRPSRDEADEKPDTAVKPPVEPAAPPETP
jgi:hypothetical protein